VIVEIAGDDMHFQTLTDRGETVDSGVIRRQAEETARAVK
jgi:hypothetical protein